MKYLLITLLFLTGCMYGLDYEKADKHVHLRNYQVNITEVNVQKYSTVYGYIYYKGKKYKVKSTGGYYYKRYNLTEGQEIYVDVHLYFFINKKDEDNPYDDVTMMVIKDLDLSEFEIKNQ